MQQIPEDSMENSEMSCTKKVTSIFLECKWCLGSSLDRDSFMEGERREKYCLWATFSQSNFLLQVQLSAHLRRLCGARRPAGVSGCSSEVVLSAGWKAVIPTLWHLCHSHRLYEQAANHCQSGYHFQLRRQSPHSPRSLGLSPILTPFL